MKSIYKLFILIIVTKSTLSQNLIVKGRAADTMQANIDNSF
jgi:hypothetical protein